VANFRTSVFMSFVFPTGMEGLIDPFWIFVFPQQSLYLPECKCCRCAIKSYSLTDYYMCQSKTYHIMSLLCSSRSNYMLKTTGYRTCQEQKDKRCSSNCCNKLKYITKSARCWQGKSQQNSHAKWNHISRNWISPIRSTEPAYKH
jgi:hypothetical protein